MTLPNETATFSCCRFNFFGESLSRTRVIGQYAKNFDVDEMWEKIASAASKAGQDVIVMVLTMYYSIEDYIKKLKK